MSEQDKIMTVPFTVRSYESDASRRVTLQTLCNYLQETAWLHAARLGFALADREGHDKTWVLLRLHVNMVRYPVWGDTISVSTWPSGRNRLYAYRDFEIRDSGDEVLGTATSSWIIIDAKKRRPQRIPDELEHSILRSSAIAFHDALFRDEPVGPERIDAEMSFNVRLSDIDVNNHVNNVNFIEWAIEAVPAAWRNDNALTELHVAFKSESNYGDRIVSQFGAMRPGERALHRVLRPSDSKSLMLAETVWKPLRQQP
ncbi:MAG: Acyl-ACP thioesterase [Verrucomicrobia bacterium ADurb.Bin345]|nr:MAG: Acyl-ACP thioesterase [Verrucomicrobia bacterium ADurb.Bin345]